MDKVAVISLVHKYMKFVKIALDNIIFLISNEYISIYTYVESNRDAFKIFTKVILSIK